MANLALLLHLTQRAERFFERSARVDAMQLIEVDAFELEPAEAHFDTLNQISGAANILGFGRALARDAAFGGDNEIGRVRIEGFADEALCDLGAVCVGGVDQVDAEIDGAAQDAAGFLRFVRLTPGALAHKAHRSVTESMYREIATNLESAGGSCGEMGHHAYDAKRFSGRRTMAWDVESRAKASGNPSAADCVCFNARDARRGRDGDDRICELAGSVLPAV